MLLLKKVTYLKINVIVLYMDFLEILKNSSDLTEKANKQKDKIKQKQKISSNNNLDNNSDLNNSSNSQLNSNSTYKNIKTGDFIRIIYQKNSILNLILIKYY